MSYYKHQTSKLSWSLAALTGFFLLMQFALLLPTFKPLFASGFVRQASQTLPMAILPGLFMNLLINILLWVVVTGLIWLMSYLNGRLLKLDDNGLMRLGIVLWLLAVASVLLANQYYFPRSVFGDLMQTLISPAITKILLVLILGTLLLALFTAIVAATEYFTKTSVVFIAVIVSISVYPYIIRAAKPPTPNKPNVIIIGIDSLRPDYLNYTPHLNKVLQTATRFSQAITPFGRTFPAWVNILTGLYPPQDGARYDLIPPSKLHLQSSLGKLLQQQGYETVYATDEKRFSNIDKQFGFDVVLGPRMGFNDFFLGVFSDFPLANILMNTRLGPWLFPYQAANRAASTKYIPQSFDKLIKRFLQRPRRKPLFFAIHYCMPHFPYIWSATPLADIKNMTLEKLHQHYKKTLPVVDTQFYNLWQSLQANGLLKNSIVVILSDHGESWGEPNARLINAKTYAHKPKSPRIHLKQVIGHGTDLLIPQQFQVVLGFRLFGAAKNSMKTYDFPVSLIDIKPTILNFLQQPYKTKYGMSLYPYLLNAKTPAPNTRPIFMETGFSPEGFFTGRPTLTELLKLGLQAYEINPGNGRVIIKDKTGKRIIANKQRAVLYGNWLLALYPRQDKMIPVLVNMKTKQWSDNFNSKFVANSPGKKMLRQLRQLYGKEIKPVL